MGICANRVSVRLHIYAFSELKNKLILNFYWEMLRYLRFTYLSTRDTHKTRDDRFLMEEETDKAGFMRKAFEGDFENGINYLLNFCSQAEKEYGLEEMREIPFRWNVYWQRPQICYTLASTIILKIIKGTYPIGGSLPSLAVMSDQLNVSFRTLRRTLSILNSLGVIRLHQGKVSEICTEISSIDFERPEIREGFRYYRDSLQFMTITVRSVFLYTIENIKKEDCDYLANEFIRIFNRSEYRRCFKLTLDFILEFCPLAAVRECYDHLANFLIWGYPLAVYCNGKDALTEDFIRESQNALECLSERRWGEFADRWKALNEAQLKEVNQYLLQYGI